MQQPLPITKAIIPVAGWGTRRMPIAKAIEKCMLPICNRPVVDYCVEDCITAGIEDIYFVVSPDFEQLRSYYSNNVPLEEYLAQRGKANVLDTLQAIPRKANFHYIVQDPAGAYGTAVPLWIARDAIQPGEQFVVMFGDGIVFHEDGSSEINHLKQAIAQTGAAAALLGVEVSDTEIAKYAAIKTLPADHGYDIFDGLVEKPAPGTAPSNLASISNYILPSDIFPHIEKVLQVPNEHGEHFLTDAVNDYAIGANNMIVVPSTGQFLDGGELGGWIHANNVMYQALQRQ
jgi:UTP--glucose-1-phosphate uridylyltransferase